MYDTLYFIGSADVIILVILFLKLEVKFQNYFCSFFGIWLLKWGDSGYSPLI